LPPLDTFLGYDGVPWNNNNSEHVVKVFAAYREMVDNQLTEAGLNQYLVLLIVYQTCKCKGVTFLKFLLSGQEDIDAFCENGGKRVLPTIELYPKGNMSSRPSRKGLRAESAEEGPVIPTAPSESPDQPKTPC
jgi:hypothetical protein